MNSKDLKNLQLENVKCDNTEVLVLPPDILHQFGINFATIHNYSESLEKKENLEDNYMEANNSSIQAMAMVHESTSGSDSSILETANLMKESVLLSPTFTTPTLNQTNSNDEVTNILHENYSHHVELIKDEPQMCIKESCNEDNKELEENLNSIKDAEVGCILSTSNKIEDDNNVVVKNIENNFVKNGISYDDEESINKINILSEEIIELNNINEPRSSSAPKTTNFTPVKVNTPLNSITKTNNKQEDLCDLCSCFEKPEITNTIQDTLSKNSKYEGSKSHLPNCEQLCNNKFIKDTCNKSNNEKNDDLSKHLFNRQQSPSSLVSIVKKSISRNINLSKDLVFKEVNIQREDSKDKEINSDEDIVTSKLCVQGVEKPGGEISGLRTYLRYKRNISRPQTFNRCLSENVSFNLEHNIDSDGPYPNTTNIQNQCICQDFGSFSFYEENESYEHIHFWKTANDSCSIDILFGIYEDENFIEDRTNNEVEVYEKFTINDVVDEINGFNGYCHTSIACDELICTDSECKNINSNCITSPPQSTLNDDALENSDLQIVYKIINKENISNSSMDEADNNGHMNECDKTSAVGDSSYEIPTEYDCSDITKHENFKTTYEESDSDDQCLLTIKNERKRSSKNDDLSYKPSPKKVLKTVECGVCKAEMTSVKWNEHIRNKHDYIAWKKGENINLEDRKLFKKLKYRLRETERLTCTFCSIQIYFVKDFIKHISICINRRIKSVPIVCGVCHSEIEQNLWMTHICKEHNYLAWENGKTSLDLTDETKIVNHLKAIKKIVGGRLQCSNCGIKRKTVKSYIFHLKRCANIDLILSEQQQAQIDGVILSLVKCGVCKAELERDQWIEHICMEHNYLAWKEGETPLDVNNSEKVKEYLYDIAKEIDGLVCAKCKCRRRYVKSFLNHIQTCDGTKDSIINDTLNNYDLFNAPDLKSIDESFNVLSLKLDKDDRDCEVECGTCHKKIKGRLWFNHIEKDHDYLAWIVGETPIDIEDSEILKYYLNTLSKVNNGLLCGKCGVRRKYVKIYLSHIQKCDGITDSSLNETNAVLNFIRSANDNNNWTGSEVKAECGVCHQQVEGKDWLYHLQKQHSYMAWKEGETPVDLFNKEDVHNHLYEMCKRYNGLQCSKCGIVRKYVKKFLGHIETCEVTSNVDIKLMSSARAECSPDSCQCAVCGEIMNKRNWKSHSMNKHYNVAWFVGDYPIDFKNPNVVDKYLKEYKSVYKTLCCRLCGATRASNLGFYAHIIQCGKTEEEIDEYRTYCDICNSKYLSIYRYQHQTMHRTQELAKERLCEMVKEEAAPGEGRKAAKKARNILEKYNSYEFNCEKCGYGADEEKELLNHTCAEINDKKYSDSEVSIKLDETESEDTESGVDSNVSDEELRKDKRRRHGESISAAARIKRIPFEIRNAKYFMQQTVAEFREAYYTNETLYPQWLKSRYKMVDKEYTSKYMPPLEESCNLIFGNKEWRTLKKFEGTNEKNGLVMFVGSSIQCISWAPPRHDEDGSLSNYLVVSCHGATDVPRINRDVIYQSVNMLQIWDFGNIKTSIPKFVLGIAHDYGIVWDFDWCPSGAQEVFIDNPSKEFVRLGLLAIACSNGLAYILSVPYPSAIIDSDNIIYELTPVAELRLGGGERNKCQATSINWSIASGHSTVMVGYSDGTTALYDLHSDSPLLTDKENNLNIFYPYHDQRPHNASVTGVTTFPLKYNSSGLLVCSASSTSADSTRRGRGSGARLQLLQPASGAAYLPHWPTALLAADDSTVNSALNELDWWGVGRRFGSTHSSSACLQCGVLATFAPPLLRIVKPHPVYTELDKEVLATFNMAPLSKKRSKQKNDDLAIKLEPLTYEDAIKSYGVEFKLAKELDMNKKQIQNMHTEQYPERFPMADVTSMAYNLSMRHHRKLALATQVGLIFLIKLA